MSHTVPAVAPMQGSRDVERFLGRLGTETKGDRQQGDEAHAGERPPGGNCPASKDGG